MTDIVNQIAEQLYDRAVCSPAQNYCRNDAACQGAADLLTQQADEIERLRAAQQWQPIETAP